MPIRKGNPVDNLNHMDEEKGVSIEDMGIKMSLNGIDNGKLVFNQVKVPRSALLDKLNQVTADGTFVSKTKKTS